MVMGADRSDPLLEIKGICRSSQVQPGPLAAFVKELLCCLTLGGSDKTSSRTRSVLQILCLPTNGALAQGSLIAPGGEEHIDFWRVDIHF